MSLQALWALFLAHPAQAVNGLALFFGVAGAWLLLASTRPPVSFGVRFLVT